MGGVIDDGVDPEVMAHVSPGLSDDVYPPAFKEARQSDPGHPAPAAEPPAPDATAGLLAQVTEPQPSKPLNWGVKPEGMGVSLSGGGIRSASYCLGALQTFTKHNMLFGPPGQTRAKYLSSVSGGSYIATAVTMVAEGRIRPADNVDTDVKGAKAKAKAAKAKARAAKDAEADKSIDVPLGPPAPDDPDLRPFATGTPEERYLRNHTLYLTHAPGGLLGIAWRVLLGVLFNATIVAVALAAFSLPLGWFYGWAWPSLRARCQTSCLGHPAFAVPAALWWVVIGLGSAAVLSGFVWLAWRFQDRRVERVWNRRYAGVLSAVLVTGTILTLLFGVAIPVLIHLARPAAAASALPGTAQTTRKTVAAVTSAGLLGLVLAWLAVAKRLLATPSTIEKGLAKVALGFVERHKALAVNVVAAIAGPGLVLAGVVMLAFVGAGHRPGFSRAHELEEFFGWIGCLLVLVLVWWRADVTAWSLYPLYRRRLSSAFVLGRVERQPSPAPSPTAVGNQDADERPYEIPYRLSQFPGDHSPEVLICASANISNYGATPSGSHVTSFVFSPSWIGGPLVGSVSTSSYETGTGDTQGRFTTLPTAMAISGAAIAPSMGRMTRTPFRFFLALANLRLGVWVPNPRRLPKFTNKRVRFLRPGPQYFVREMLGRNLLDAPFLYVTDGGHYENLGLVELLRRKCETIWCLDASGDQIDAFDTLGGALRIADAELGVTVTINPQQDMAPSPTSPTTGPRYVRSPFSRGTIKYPDQTEGTIIVVKAGVPRNAPWSVRSFLAAHPTFPCDPTLDQLYDAERFDAYRELGAFSVEQAIARWGKDQQGPEAPAAPAPSPATPSPAAPSPVGPHPGGPTTGS